MSQKISKSSVKKSEWLELFPYGVTLGPESARPLMIFKDESEKHTLPVWLSPLDAGIAISQTDMATTAGSPHNLTWKILEPLGIELEKVLFVEVKGHHQFVELHFINGDDSKKVEKLRSRADEAMSFCLSTKTRFYCKTEFINECKVMEAEMMGLAEGLSLNPDLVSDNPHPYLN